MARNTFLIRLEPTDQQDRDIIDTLAQLPPEQVFSIMQIIRSGGPCNGQAVEPLRSWPAEHVSRLCLMVEDTTDDFGLNE